LNSPLAPIAKTTFSRMVPWMKAVIAVILVALGIAIIVMGHNRSESVEVLVEGAATDVANAIDGEARQPDHVWYYVGGGVLIAAGAVVFFRKSGV
jgi:uncharacterized membrane protein YidH (DUF202 family)